MPTTCHFSGKKGRTSPPLPCQPGLSRQYLPTGVAETTLPDSLTPLDLLLVDKLPGGRERLRCGR